eukprot:tig00000923_g5475.t1
MEGPPDTTARLARLRELMRTPDVNAHAYIVPSEDAHQSEYVSDHDKRRQFISNFTGSAGLAVITETEALLWTDGRYFDQAKKELDQNWKLMRIPDDATTEKWLKQNLPAGARVAVDPRFVSIATAERWRKKIEKRNMELVPVRQNLVDAVWGAAQPPAPREAAFLHPLRFAGESVASKLGKLREKVAKSGCEGIVVTALDEVAWLFNIRGADVFCTPVVWAYAAVTASWARLYIDPRKVAGEEVAGHLRESGVEVRPYDAFFAELEALPSPPAQPATQACPPAPAARAPSPPTRLLASRPAQAEDGAPKKRRKGESAGVWWVDGSKCNLAVQAALKAARRGTVEKQSPLALLKACKNEAELAGLRAAHARDAAALCAFFAWLHDCLATPEGRPSFGPPRPEPLDECSAADVLEQFRREQEHFVGLSFETISAVDGNAAIIHYKPKHGSCALLRPGCMYLCDSGGQYADGTTDVTRTLHYGEPTPHQRECYTRVLQGHIALDAAVFPAGTTGHVLDILARCPLWRVGLDYRHGTGHGVGAYLCVHEGPQLVSFRPSALDTGLQASMTVTDEPGYYEPGERPEQGFGIRIENVLVTRKLDLPHRFADKDYLGFEHITLVPLERKLIDVGMLSAPERRWIDDYHAEIRAKIAPRLSGRPLEWLLANTEPLS